jgi:mycoredoxin
MRDKLVVYGTQTCPDTQRTRHQLESLGVPYEYVDVEKDEAADARVKEWNGGRRMTPTVLMPRGNVVTGRDRMVVPSDRDLEEALRENGIMR